MAEAVLVTGGGLRIGAAIARRFAAGGALVHVHYHTSEGPARALVDEIGKGSALSFDLACPQAVAQGVADLAMASPSLDTLVVNASLFLPDRPLATDPAVHRQSLAVNLTGNLALIDSFMRTTGDGRARTVIVLLDQKLAHLNPDFFSYTLSKSALASAVEMIAQEMAPGDRCYGVAPGLCQVSHDQTAEEFARSARMNLLARLNSAEEVADAVWFMAGRHLANGAVLLCDSGQHLLHQPRDVMYVIREQT